MPILDRVCDVLHSSGMSQAGYALLGKVLAMSQTPCLIKLTHLVAGYFEIQCQSVPKWATIFAGALSLFLTIPSSEKALSFLNAAQDSSNGPTCGSGNASFPISQTVSGLPFCFER